MSVQATERGRGLWIILGVLAAAGLLLVSWITRFPWG
jgi:hypothetical protein